MGKGLKSVDPKLQACEDEETDWAPETAPKGIHQLSVDSALEGNIVKPQWHAGQRNVGTSVPTAKAHKGTMWLAYSQSVLFPHPDSE